MVRRSFRLGLRLGLLAGILLALVKLVQARRASREEAWAPAPDGGPATTATGDGGTATATGESAWPPLAPTPVEPVPVEPPTPTVTRPAAPMKMAADPTDAVTGPITAAPKAPATPDEPAAAAPAPTPAPAPRAPAKASPAPAKASPAPAKKASKRTAKRAGTRRRRRWVEAMGNECPTSHPVKAKLSSMLYHLPGMAAYNRTRPDRCYLDGPSAEEDGFTRAKR